MQTVNIEGTEYAVYRKANTQPMRAYVPGESLDGVSVSKEDAPGDGGMIACNQSNPADKWYVAADFMRANYVPA